MSLCPCGSQLTYQ
ncbi:hypothetical protein HKB15_29015, partial [Vibrio parahaemolyticus]|nr:hypothetical protein [Vibrio parahaemolyticus]